MIIRPSNDTRTTTDFEVVNRIGRVVYSSNHADVAKGWARANLRFHGELEVQEVTTTTTVSRTRVYRPNAKPVQPGMPDKGWVHPMGSTGAVA